MLGMTAVKCSLPSSLGITLLELACDIELPSGGENWHKLRSGEFFSQITQSRLL